MEDVRLIAIPFYDSLSIRRNWKDIRQLYPDIINYFPDYDPEYMPSRKFFWEVFASLHYEDAKTIIKNERKRKYNKESSDKTKEITINKDVLDLIQGLLYFSKKKGRALYNIKPKEYEINPRRKRKLSELDEYEGDKHEISVFNTNRESKRMKHDEINSAGLIKLNTSSNTSPLAISNPFRMNNKPFP